MNEQDPFAFYSFFEKQATILEEPVDYNQTQTITRSTVKAIGRGQKENRYCKDMDGRERTTNKRMEMNYNAAKQNNRRAGVVSESDEEDIVVYRDGGLQTTPPNEQRPQPIKTPVHRPHSSSNKSPADTLAGNGKQVTTPLSRIKTAKSTARTLESSSSKEDDRGQAASSPTKQPGESKKSWGKRALARTKDVLSITAKEPSTMAFEEFRQREFKKAGVKPGDNAAAKLHVSSQKLPPEAPNPKSKDPPPLSKSTTDTNTERNKNAGKVYSGGSKSSTATLGGPRSRPGGSNGAPSIASSGSRDSSVFLSGGGSSNSRVSFGSANGLGLPPDSGNGRLMHSQMDGAPRRAVPAGTPGSAGSAVSGKLTLNKKQKEAAIDDRW